MTRATASRWHDWVIPLVGFVHVTTSFLVYQLNRGEGAAWFYGLVGGLLSVVVLVQVGKLLAWGIGWIRPMGEGGRLAITVAPVLLLSVLLGWEGYRESDPRMKFEQWVASPAPASLNVLSAYMNQGLNFRMWAFHVTLAPQDVPAMVSCRPFQHQTDDAGFDLERYRDQGRTRPGYPIPPLDFKAVHRYRLDDPTRGRLGLSLSLYGNASQAEFFVYGFVE